MTGEVAIGQKTMKPKDKETRRQRNLRKEEGGKGAAT